MEKQVYSAKKSAKKNYRAGIRAKHSKITVMKDGQRLVNVSRKHSKARKTFKRMEKIALRKKLNELK